jgi:hypothetical protein
MTPNFSFTAQKRESGYVFVAKQYGVVVWAKDLVSGVKELESRVENVAAQLQEAGVELPKNEVDSVSRNQLSSLQSPFVKTLILALFVLVVIAWPISLIYTRVSTIEHPVTLLLHLANKVDEVGAPRMDELRLAVRKVATKLAPLVEEAKMALTTEQSKRGSEDDRRNSR